MMNLESLAAIFAASSLMVFGMPEPRPNYQIPPSVTVLAPLSNTEIIGHTLSIRTVISLENLNP